MVGLPGNFSLSAQPNIIFGAGSIDRLGELIPSAARRVLLITGNRSWTDFDLKSKVEKSLHKQGIAWERYRVSGEPSPLVIDEAVSSFQSWKPEAIVAVGGGSVLDAGKAISAMFCEEGGVKHYLEGVGDRIPSGKRLGLVAVPTTSGTGSEATKNAVISELGVQGFKKSLRHDNYIPDLAIVDPELTLNCPTRQTCASGMDAFTQLLESFVSTKANPYTDALALSGLIAISRSLHKVFKDPGNLDARTDLSYAALMSGITLANAGLGVIHGFAQPLGSLFPIPHGIVCGSLMGPANRITLTKIAEAKNIAIFKKYAVVGKLFSDKPGLSDVDYAKLLIEEIYQYTEEFAFPRFSDFGITEKHIPEILSKTGLKNHPIKLDEAELKTIILERL